MDLSTLLRFLGGIVLLVAGAEALVRGASRIALAFGIPPLIVGLTVVACGTSSPEMAVSVSSALKGGAAADIALGNVVGSNIFNILFILGASALIAPLVVALQLVRIEVPLMIGVSLGAWLLCLDGKVSRLDGALLAAGAVAYTALQVVLGRRERGTQGSGAPVTPPGGSRWADAALVLGGLVLLVVGSRWLVAGAVALARTMGVSELVIGLTIVAAGTSLPEVATSLLAAARGQRDIAVGNVVGSNIFNLLAVLGLSAAVAPGGIRVSTAALDFDLPVMIAIAVACLPIVFTGHLIARWEGALFLGYYALYTAYLVLASQQHDAIHTFRLAVMGAVLPLTAVTLGVLAAREWRARHG